MANVVRTLIILRTSIHIVVAQLFPHQVGQAKRLTVDPADESFASFFDVVPREEARGIPKVDRIAFHVLIDVSVEINKAKGVLTNEPAQCRTVVASAVVLQAVTIVFATGELIGVAAFGAAPPAD